RDLVALASCDLRADGEVACRRLSWPAVLYVRPSNWRAEQSAPPADVIAAGDRTCGGGRPVWLDCTRTWLTIVHLDRQLHRAHAALPRHRTSRKVGIR